MSTYKPLVIAAGQQQELADADVLSAPGGLISQGLLTLNGDAATDIKRIVTTEPAAGQSALGISIGDATGTPAAINLRAEEAWTSTAKGSSVQVRVTAVGTNTLDEVGRFYHYGLVVTGSLTASNGLTLTAGNITLANGAGLVAAAGASFKTGPDGGTWMVQPASSNASYFALNDSTGANQWVWDSSGNLTTSKNISAGIITATGGQIAVGAHNGLLYESSVAGDVSVRTGVSGGAGAYYTFGANGNFQALSGGITAITDIVTGNGYRFVGGAFQSNAGCSAPSNPAAFGYRASGAYGGGIGFIDGSYGMAIYSVAGSMNFATGSSTSISSKVTIDGTYGSITSPNGTVNGIRLFTGWDSGVNGAVSCNNWFRSTGQTGWYSSDYGGGIYCIDATYLRSYNNRAMVASDFVISSDERLKSGIRPLPYRGRLTPIAYTMTATGASEIGFGAGAVRALYPELVDEDPVDGTLKLKYNRVAAVLSAQINRLEDLVAAQQAQIAALSRPWWARLLDRVRKA